MAWMPVSQERHFDKAVSPIRDFSFARNNLLVPILIPELHHASNTIPLVFARKNGVLDFFGLVGLEKNHNVYVNADGNWLVKFIPVCLQTYPCALGEVNGDKITLLVKEDSGLLVERDEGYPFFNEDGSNGRAIKDYKILFRKILRAKEAIKQACLMIEDCGLLEPYLYKRSQINEKDIQIDGLFSISEAAFRQLSESKYIELRKLYAIDLIYAHMYSQGRIEYLLHNMKIQKKSQSTLRHLGADIFGEAELDFGF